MRFLHHSIVSRAAVIVVCLLSSACSSEDPRPAAQAGDENPHAGAPAESEELRRDILASDKGLGPGRWRRFRTHRFDPGLDPEQRERLEELEAVGYLSGSVEARSARGVTLYREEKASPGLNFYTSGHAPEAILMDMNGRIRHRWRYDFWEAWPNFPVKKDHPMTEFWRRAYLYENGDILAIYEGLGLIKLDRDSNLIWAFPGRTHHDLEVMPNGDIYVLTREARIVPRIDSQRPILEDFISILDADGNEKKRVSLLEAFEDTPFEHFTGRMRPYGDIFHTNTLFVLSGRIADDLPAFARGNVLTSMLYLDAIAVVDMETGKVTWAMRGSFRRQHDPKVLENGHLLLFDNRGRPRQSAVLEVDPVARTLAWEYRGTGDEPFFSSTCGTAQRLPNRNTLITESDNGRAFEVTPEGEIVWEFHNPQRAGEHGEYVATLFEVVRLPPDFPVDWIQDGETAPPLGSGRR